MIFFIKNKIHHILFCRGGGGKKKERENEKGKERTLYLVCKREKKRKGSLLIFSYTMFGWREDWKKIKKGGKGKHKLINYWNMYARVKWESCGLHSP